MIRKRSSHIPIFTRTVVKNIHLMLRRTPLNSHIGTGMKNAVIRNSMNRKMYGIWKTWSSLSTISGPSRVYRANTHSRKKKKNHVVATMIRSLPIASKWSGRKILST